MRIVYSGLKETVNTVGFGWVLVLVSFFLGKRAVSLETFYWSFFLW